MDKSNYQRIVAHYEACLAKHGDTHLGVDWPNPSDAETRYRVMLEVIGPNSPRPIRLLDFGCGTSHLYEHILRRGYDYIHYSGLDISEKFISVARRKFPSIDYYCADVLAGPAHIPVFDYVVMNGVFTEKRDLSFSAMLDYFQTLLSKVYALAHIGLAFNVMSKHVDWERDDLFHLPFDMLAAFLVKNLSRHFVFRQDYGLYEYTTYLYRDA
jgi:SAM-dependent methyltransferase